MPRWKRRMFLLNPTKSLTGSANPSRAIVQSVSWNSTPAPRPLSGARLAVETISTKLASTSGLPLHGRMAFDVSIGKSKPSVVLDVLFPLLITVG